MILQYGITSCPPEWIVDEKISPGFSRLYYITGGEVTYYCREERQDLQRGYLYFFPSAVPYTIIHNPDNPLECLYFHLDFFPRDLQRISGFPLFEHPVLISIVKALELSIENSTVFTLKPLIETVILYCREKKLLHFPDSELSPVMQYMIENLDRDLTIDSLSRKAGYNEQYFIRLFKEKFGITPYQFIIGYRMKEARKLLKSQLTISEIAEKTGYSDVKSFSRAFRKNNGISPSDFRKTPATGP